MNQKLRIYSEGKLLPNLLGGKEFEIIEKKAIKEIFGCSKIALKPDATVAITGVVKNVNAIKYLSKNSVRFVSDPKSIDKLFVKIDKDFILDELGNRIPTIFSQEIDVLLKNGYKIEGNIAKKIK
ncbi:hypothetical protein MKS83_07070 [Chryseobacterium sp. Y16C]|uniref:hypothetical protein n=1 Tax=Chryseobacterium sp. Y16C TaxID=2920939 RepID=UPI001F0BAC3E|nr:hypothetical protein [Chryseobacterium sp. Y16C]UMQ43453.1 hypothetical protein MKS83_07070 [Chryseobacterium sp. Y16C]